MPTDAGDGNLNKFLRKRQEAFNRLHEIYDYANNSVQDPCYKQNLSARADFITDIYKEFQQTHNSIIALISDADFDEHDKVRARADRYVYAVKGKMLTLSQTGSDSSTARVVAPTSVVRLPKISIPMFDGNIKLWPSFFDLYNSLIHTNNQLSGVEKFHYLLTSLQSEPFNLIKSLPVTDNNYQIAYDILIKRYQNKRFLATTYFNEMFTAPSLPKGSSAELRRILNVFSENLEALKALNFDVDSWDFPLFNILLQKLDPKTRTDFEIAFSTVPMPTYKNLIDFLGNQCRALESVRCMTPATYNKTGRPDNTASQPTSGSRKSYIPSSCIATEENGTSSSSANCLLCSGLHALIRCPVFLSKTPQERFSIVKQHNLCGNCVRSPHSPKKCSSSNRCKICTLPHHTLLHFNKNSVGSSSVNPNISNAKTLMTSQSRSSDTASYSQSPDVAIQPPLTINTLPSRIHDASVSSVNCTTCNTSKNSLVQSTVLLSTAEVDIRDAYGSFQKIRVLFDTASMVNFISEKCFKRLGLSRQHCHIPIEGINNLLSASNNGLTQCFIRPCGKSAPTFTFEAIILPKVCSDQPKIVVDSSKWSHISQLPLADSRFHTPGPVDMLLGAELVPFMEGPGRAFGEPGQPVAIETVFGWILQGRAECPTADITVSSCHTSLGTTLDSTLKDFWEIEQVTHHQGTLSPDDVKCEKLYNQYTCRENSGRFVVALPFKQPEPDFGDTYSQALRRLLCLEKRLSKNNTLHQSYSNFILDYLRKNYISEVPFSNYQSRSAFYLPHHCVLKPESTSTKLRIVFDASSKGSKGLSLNDCLLAGPKLHQDLSSILFKFRIFPIAFICDIKQMYSQILVTPEHRRFQRFLWRFSPSEEIREYTLNRVTFGVSSAPFLALRTLKELALVEESNHPLASQVLQNYIYIDDCLAGSTSVDSALKLQADLIDLLRKGGFELGKWASNHPAILEAVSSEERQTPLDFDSEGPSFIKVLGLQWNPNSDMFSFTFRPVETTCTKRNILSQIARIFDPLGFLAPTVFLAKSLLQRLWLSEVSWDEVPSDEIIAIWTLFKSELPELANIQIPRLFVDESISRLEIHGFCDASLKGYGCVIYFRFLTGSGNVKVRLISGKSRVSPLKTISVPRLELCAAQLLADLIQVVKTSYTEYRCFDSVFAWSDSQVALTWLSSSPHRWKTFIANRVGHIQDILPIASWKYIPSHENPADCVSRGLSPSQLVEHNLWWHGPAFLQQDCRFWPPQPSFSEKYCPQVSEEEKRSVLHVAVEPQPPISLLISKFSSLKKTQRILAYVLRFISLLKRSSPYKSLNLDSSETSKSLQILVKEVQKECFSEIIRACVKNTSLPKPFRKLSPFLDEVGILRVGGRLSRASLSFDVKHPILLPKQHSFTDLIISQAHQEHFHPGLKALHNIILQNFWIISPRNAIYKCLSKCLRCFRVKPRNFHPLMADLPIHRISQVKAFSQISLDYAGPFTITLGRHRGAKTIKAYLCIFVCCATKAIHLELSSDLSSESFLASFRRFIARRGRVSDIYSDQGTNFKGAYRQLKELAEAAASELCIKWHFNPPGAPHFNGLSEAGVKSVKTHIFRVIGTQVLTYEELYTLLVRIEALLNSRPLSPISEDPNDLNPLTPGHFLTLEPLSSFPEPDLTPVPVNRLTRWQLLQRLHTDFWKRWHMEYLHTLQQRCKWTKSLQNVQLGMLVLIKNEQRPPLEWSLGRITQLHPGEDGVVRVVTLKTQSGELQRPVVKICPLPGQ